VAIQQRLNNALIPSKTGGALTGADYAWTDSSVQPGAAYFYKLEDVDIFGATNFHGPVSVPRAAPATFTIFLPFVRTH
jgi:hypothetical protein